MPTKPSPLQVELPTAAALALDRSRPTVAALAMELAGIFLVLPLLVRWRVIAAPRLVVLALVTLACIGLLWRDPTFDRSRLFSLGRLRGSLGSIALRGALAAVLIGALVLLLRPSALFAMPTREPGLWLAGLVLYPLLSAWPQEVVFRLFFFHRYEPLLGAGGTMLAANAVAFGFLHVIYQSPVATLLSLPAGLLLGLTWRRTGRLGPVWLEHSIYGLLLFTLGLGGYFFDGRS
jgi:membrane protease YdiL (CAAX protease family)